MKAWFLRRGHLKNLVESEIKKVKFSYVSNNRLQKRTYHSLLNLIGKVLSKKLDTLYMDEKVKNVFVQDPWFHFRVPGKLVAIL